MWPNYDKLLIAGRDKTSLILVHRPAIVLWTKHAISALHLRNCGINLQYFTQRLFQGIQPLLVMPPLLDTIGVDGLAYLFSAGGTNRSLVFKKTQTIRFKIQPTIIQ